MLEKNEQLEEREALKQKGAQKLKQIERYLLKLANLAEHNPRDYEEYELLLKPKDNLSYYDLSGKI